MRLSLCTISFRHHLIGLKDIAFWARDHGFQGIELWGVHALHQPPLALHNAQWMAAQGLSVPMISDYLPLHDQALLQEKTRMLCSLAHTWGAGKIRTFAGKTGSADCDPTARRDVIRALHEACAIVADHGLRLLVETHPGTLADTLNSTMDLIAQVGHPNLAINFDTLHVWEGGDDPLHAHRMLRPFIAHYHLKNVRSRDALNVFAPDNVYNAAGDRAGMVPLFEGAFEYSEFLQELMKDPDCEASLEWFGPEVFDTLRQDAAQVFDLLGKRNSITKGTAA